MKRMQRSLASPGLLTACVVTCLAALSPAATVGQSLDYRDAKQAPPSWVHFAKLVQYRFESWIDGDDEIATRFRKYVTDHAANEGGLPPALAVKAWVNPDGTVAKVSFSALNDPKADTDLRTILTRGNIGEAPPADMLQPLNLRFSLNKKTDKPDSAAPAK
jgi:hypothetical protein